MTDRILHFQHAPVLLQRGLVLLALTLAGSLTGCGGDQSKADDPNSVEALLKGGAAPSATPSGDGEDKPKWSDKASNKATDEELNEAQKTQMEIALRRGGDKAANCASVVPDSAKGDGEVKVTFNGKKGRATDVAVGAPWAGTDAEACIKRAFVGEIIVPFEGELEVPYTVHVGPKGGDTDKGGKTKPKKK